MTVLTNFYRPILLFTNQKWFYFFFFFFVFWHASIHHLVGCHAPGINSLLIYFLHPLHSSYLLHQVISLTWIMVLSIFTKISASRSILLKCIVLRSKSSLKKETLSESSLTKTKSSLENQTSSSFSIILLVTIYLETNFGRGRQTSTALLYISWVLYLSRQYFSIIKVLWKQLYHTFHEYINQEHNQIQKDKQQ